MALPRAIKFSEFLKKRSPLTEKKLIFDKVDHGKTSVKENIESKLNLTNSLEDQSRKNIKKSSEYNLREIAIVSKSSKAFVKKYKYSTPIRGISKLDEFLEKQSKKLGDKPLSNRSIQNTVSADKSLEKNNSSMQNHVSATNTSEEKSDFASTNSANLSSSQKEIDSDETNVLIRSPNNALVCKEKSKSLVKNYKRSRENVGTSKLDAFFLQHSDKLSQLPKLKLTNKNDAIEDKCNKNWEQLCCKKNVFLDNENDFKRKMSEEVRESFKKQKSGDVGCNAKSQVLEDYDKDTFNRKELPSTKAFGEIQPRIFFSNMNRKRSKSTSSDETIRRKFSQDMFSEFSNELSSDDLTESIAKGDSLQRNTTNALSPPDNINVDRASSCSRFSVTFNSSRKLPSRKAFGEIHESMWKFKGKKVRKINNTSSDSSSSGNSKTNRSNKNIARKNWTQFTQKRPSTSSGNKCSGNHKPFTKDCNKQKRTECEDSLWEIKMRCMRSFIERNSFEIRNIQEKNMFFQQELQEQNVLNPAPGAVTKLQRNLFSSEGFHESMSYETPTIITNNKVQGTSEECRINERDYQRNIWLTPRKSKSPVNKNNDALPKQTPSSKILTKNILPSFISTKAQGIKKLEVYNRKSPDTTQININTGAKILHNDKEFSIGSLSGPLWFGTSSSKILTKNTLPSSMSTKAQANKKVEVYNRESSDTTQINTGTGGKTLHNDKEFPVASLSGPLWFEMKNTLPSFTPTNAQVNKKVEVYNRESRDTTQINMGTGGKIIQNNQDFSIGRFGTSSSKILTKNTLPSFTSTKSQANKKVEVYNRESPHNTQINTGTGGIILQNNQDFSNGSLGFGTSSSKILTKNSLRSFRYTKAQGNKKVESSGTTQINTDTGGKILQNDQDYFNGYSSGPLLFESPFVSFAKQTVNPNAKAASNPQVSKIGSGNIGGCLTQSNTFGTSVSSENPKNIKMATCASNLGDSQNSSIIQNKDKPKLNILQNLYKIPESNNWETQKEQNSEFTPDLFPYDITSEQNKKDNVESWDVNKPSTSQSNCGREKESDFLFRNAAFLRDFGSSHINEKSLRTKPDKVQFEICLEKSFDHGVKENKLRSSHENDVYTQTDYEEESCFNQNDETFNQTQNSTVTDLNTTKNTIRRSRKTFKLTEDCILYEDNLLKELLEEKANIKKAYNKNKLKRNVSEESDGILAKTYIKRYRKNKTKIFKIKRRLKKPTVENYVPPEDQIMDKFINRVNNDFNEDTSSESEECDSISTPPSYRTDDTRSEALSTGSRKLSEHQKLLRQGINKLSKDNTLLFSRFSDSAPREFERAEVLSGVQKIICDILEAYEQGGQPYFMIPRVDNYNYVFLDDRYQLRKQPEYKIVTSRSPLKRARFNLILFILNKIRLLLETGTKLTKREIFYQLKTMISSQIISDNAIADIGKMLKVGIWALNITAQKGLVFGNLKLVMENGETINCNVPGILVPKDVSEICEIQSDAYFILVVEKESIFHKLLEENLISRLTRPFILITGKGFPDLNTQLFLKKLWMVMSIPVFILVDADPDGIAIMLNYRFGSLANAHVSDHLAIPKARWIGVFPSEILKLSLDYNELTKREIAKTRKLLQLQCVQKNEKLQHELEALLENGLKTGIEALMKTDTYLSHRYLSLKFYMNDLI